MLLHSLFMIAAAYAGDPCSQPATAAGVVRWIGVATALKDPVVDIRMVTPASRDPRFNPDPTTGLLCHGEMVFQSGRIEVGLLQVLAPPGDAPVQISWKREK